MPVSSARLLANRRNAQRSTGPKTSAGKERSRRNSYKHGLTGDGVVMPEAELAEVATRFQKLEDELQPSGEAGRILLRRFAYLSVRLEKCEAFETSANAERVRHAFEVFDDRRLTTVEELAVRLAREPMTVSRRLQTSPEGVDWLIRHWGELREDLAITNRLVWTVNHSFQLQHLLGDPGGTFRMSRPYALTQAVSGYFVHLDPTDGEGLDDQARIEWARAELMAIIDGEVARLREVKTALNPSLIDRDRDEAPSRALFDPSPTMMMARKYEAATERAMYKALDRFHDIELAAIETEPVVASPVVEEPCDRVASLLPGSRPITDLPKEPDDSAPLSAYIRPIPSNQLSISIGRTPPKRD